MRTEDEVLTGLNRVELEKDYRFRRWRVYHPIRNPERQEDSIRENFARIEAIHGIHMRNFGWEATLALIKDTMGNMPWDWDGGSSPDRERIKV